MERNATIDFHAFHRKILLKIIMLALKLHVVGAGMAPIHDYAA